MKTLLKLFWGVNRNHLKVTLYFFESILIRLYVLVFHRKSLPYRKYPLLKIIRIRLLMNNFIYQVSKTEAKEAIPSDLFWGGDSIKEHFATLKLICKDVLSALERQEKKQSSEFSTEAKSYLKELPNYYKRNFHYQTDGYLSKQSAQIYNHQVELLFSGTANMMRKMLFKKISELNYERKYEKKYEREKEHKILELACGNGVFTKLIANYFPNAKILATDISQPYIEFAKETYSLEERISWQAFPAERLTENLGEQPEYDFIFSCYLFHELPLKIRKQILLESYKKLKPGGLLLFLDSVQNDDYSSLNDVLENFPLDYHEPFYRNYVETPNKLLLEETGFKNLIEEVYFFSKSFGGFKN